MSDDLSSVEIRGLEHMIRDARRNAARREYQRVVIHPDDLERLLEQAKRGASVGIGARDGGMFNGE